MSLVLNWEVLNVMWASYQILAAAGDILRVRFPPPYATFERWVAAITRAGIGQRTLINTN